MEFARTKRALGDLVHAAPVGTHPPARTVILDALDRILALLAGLWTLPTDQTWTARADRLVRFVTEGLSL